MFAAAVSLLPVAYINELRMNTVDRTDYPIAMGFLASYGSYTPRSSRSPLVGNFLTLPCIKVYYLDSSSIQVECLKHARVAAMGESSILCFLPVTMGAIPVAIYLRYGRCDRLCRAAYQAVLGEGYALMMLCLLSVDLAVGATVGSIKVQW